MRPLETEDAGWIDDLASCVRELNDLMEAMDRELSHHEYDRDRHRGRGGPQMWGQEYSAHDRHDREYNRGEPANRFTRYVREWQHRSRLLLDLYRDKMR